MISLYLILFLVSLYLDLPIMPIFNAIFKVFRLISPICLYLFWSAASSVSGLALLFWYCVSSITIPKSPRLNVDVKYLMKYEKIFFCAFSVSFLSGFQLVWIVRVLRWLGRMVVYCATSFSEKDVTRAVIAFCPLFSMFLYAHHEQLQHRLQLTTLENSRLRSLTHTAPTPKNVSSPSVCEEADAAAPADLLVAAVEHLIEDNGKLVTGYNAILQHNNQVSIHNDNLSRQQMELAEKTRSLESQVTSLTFMVEHKTRLNSFLSVFNTQLQEKIRLIIENRPESDERAALTGPSLPEMRELTYSVLVAAADLKQENSSLAYDKDELAQINKEVRLLKDELEKKLSAEISDLKSKVDALSEENATLRDENETLSCKSARLDQECDKLSNECNELDDKYKIFNEIMQEVVASKNREFSNLSADMVFVESECVALKKRLTKTFNSPVSPSPAPTRAAAPDASGYLISENSSETTLANSPHPGPTATKVSPVLLQNPPKAAEFAKLLDTVALSPVAAQSLESVFSGNGLGLKLTPPSIDTVLASADAADPLTPAIGYSTDFFVTSTPPPEILKKRSACVSLKEVSTIVI